MDETGPIASRVAPNGDLYSALLFLDFNAMYLWSQEQDLPLGPGLRWTMVNGIFHKKSLKGRNPSLAELQWIYYEQEMLKRSGSNVVIQHAYLHGQEKIHIYQVDGYAIIDGQPTVYEYVGCYVSLLHVYTSTRTLSLIIYF